jgi:hypothetical protein
LPNENVSRETLSFLTPAFTDTFLKQANVSRKTFVSETLQTGSFANLPQPARTA